MSPHFIGGDYLNEFYDDHYPEPPRPRVRLLCGRQDRCVTN